VSAPAKSTFLCVGAYPHAPPCDTPISSDTGADNHARETGHGVVSGMWPEVVARVVEQRWGKATEETDDA
jgi:hypothetical protein